MTETPAIKDADNPVPLDWGHEIDEVHAGGLEIQRKATAAECAALARALDILQCDSLDVSYRLRRAPAEGYRLRGKLIAEVDQACVVTLAAVHETVRVEFDVEFRPAEEVASLDGGAVDLEEQTEIEPIDGKWLAVGRVVFEELAAGLDPYPRRPGAEFAPFAVLAKLKQPPSKESN